MFRIKICGITTVDDALLATEAGADAIGLNFYGKSPRCILPERGLEISRAIAVKFTTRKPRVIGVFVNPDELTLFETISQAELDGIQLHGDESPEIVVHGNMINMRGGMTWLARLAMGREPVFTIIKAFRCEQPNLLGVSDYLGQCLKISVPLDQHLVGESMEAMRTPLLPQAVLLDAYQPGAYGGTGQTVDWDVVREERDMLMGLPLILAGGLTHNNVAAAIATAQPDAVDVASGVESAPGKKDATKVMAFVAAAKGAFAALKEPR